MLEILLGFLTDPLFFLPVLCPVKIYADGPLEMCSLFSYHGGREEYRTDEEAQDATVE
jgi:hypothetical protein